MVPHAWTRTARAFARKMSAGTSAFVTTYTADATGARPTPSVPMRAGCMASTVRGVRGCIATPAGAVGDGQRLRPGPLGSPPASKAGG